MARIRPSNIELITKLSGFNKPYFTVADLEKILGLQKKSLLVTLTRLVKSGVLIRPRKNVYLVFSESHPTEEVANQIYFPSYLSFESALSRHGILSQIPYTLTFATTRSSKKMLLQNLEVEYSHIQNKLFFGYSQIGNINVADPEKALLDQLYLVSKGTRNISIEELDLSGINKTKLDSYANKFPPIINQLLAQVKRSI